MKNYDDIIDLPHHVSEKHPQMSMTERAAQFSPFAALTGYGDAIDEAERMTDAQIELDDDERLRIDRILREAYEAGASVEITHFVPDGRKAGGEYAVTAGTIAELNAVDLSVRLSCGETIPLSGITAVLRQDDM